MAKFLHCSSEGSYYIDCKILEKRNYNYDKDAGICDYILNKMSPSSAKYRIEKKEARLGYVIKYKDLVSGEVVKELVPEEYVEHE